MGKKGRDYQKKLGLVFSTEDRRSTGKGVGTKKEESIKALFQQKGIMHSITRPCSLEGCCNGQRGKGRLRGGGDKGDLKKKRSPKGTCEKPKAVVNDGKKINKKKNPKHTPKKEKKKKKKKQKKHPHTLGLPDSLP